MNFDKLYKFCCFATVGLLTLSSCNDFLTIYPTDKTIGEDFWKTKGDVEEIAAGAYDAMQSSDIQERAIIWGAYRSDELVQNSSYTNETLDNISAVNILPTMGYCDWSAYYAVINRCNIVLNNAQKVKDIDPNFTQGDYNVIRGQMLALRSLCYFYLVRAFRDVPYTTQNYENDNVDMALAQVAPDSVLQYCINDLKEAEGLVMKSGAYGQYNWKNFEFFTRDAVDALLADIYLWRGAMNHDNADNEQVVAYADKIIKAKDEYYRKTFGEDIDLSTRSDIYHLYRGDIAYSNIFLNGGNSRESILEMQYDGNTKSNQALASCYYRKDNDSQVSYLKASRLFNNVDDHATNAGNKFYFSKQDYRYWNNVYEVNNSELTQMYIRKMTSVSGDIPEALMNGNYGPGPVFSRSYRNFRQNWIIYRLTDVMLMKAEALVQLATGDDDLPTLKSAFGLVQTVNKRSMRRTATDTLQFESFKSRQAMETLVLNERERELCFEGKRWFDLMRYCYRHMEGVDSRKKMADQTEWPALFPSMVEMIGRKYFVGGDAVSYKMKSEPFLYWPVLQGEQKANPLLKQNPVFKVEETSNKNY